MDLWTKHGISREEYHLEIITCGQGKGITKENMEKRFVESLRKAFPNIRISLSLKKDNNRLMHARYLETDHAILHIDRGFDLFDRNNPKRFSRNPIGLVTGNEIFKTLREYQELSEHES